MLLNTENNNFNHISNHPNTTSTTSTSTSTKHTSSSSAAAAAASHILPASSVPRRFSVSPSPSTDQTTKEDAFDVDTTSTFIAGDTATATATATAIAIAAINNEKDSLDDTDSEDFSFDLDYEDLYASVLPSGPSYDSSHLTTATATVTATPAPMPIMMNRSSTPLSSVSTGSSVSANTAASELLSANSNNCNNSTSTSTTGSTNSRNNNGVDAYHDDHDDDGKTNEDDYLLIQNMATSIHTTANDPIMMTGVSTTGTTAITSTCANANANANANHPGMLDRRFSSSHPLPLGNPQQQQLQPTSSSTRAQQHHHQQQQQHNNNNPFRSNNGNYSMLGHAQNLVAGGGHQQQQLQHLQQQRQNNNAEAMMRMRMIQQQNQQEAGMNQIQNQNQMQAQAQDQIQQQEQSMIPKVSPIPSPPTKRQKFVLSGARSGYRNNNNIHQDDNDHNNNNNRNHNVNANMTRIMRMLDRCLCPLTNSLPIDPVTAEDGSTYERTAILQFWQQQQRQQQGTTGTASKMIPHVVSPMTGKSIGSTLLPNVPVQSLIESMVQEIQVQIRQEGQGQCQSQSQSSSAVVEDVMHGEKHRDTGTDTKTRTMLQGEEAEKGSLSSSLTSSSSAAAAAAATTTTASASILESMNIFLSASDANLIVHYVQKKQYQQSFAKWQAVALSGQQPQQHDQSIMSSSSFHENSMEIDSSSENKVNNSGVGVSDSAASDVNVDVDLNFDADIEATAGAMKHLAQAYEHGLEGVVIPSPSEARFWYARAKATRGNVKGIARLGLILLAKGETIRGCMMLGEAAGQGSVFSAIRLGLAYADGTDGVPQDTIEAIRLLRKGLHPSCRFQDSNESVKQKAAQRLQQLLLTGTGHPHNVVGNGIGSRNGNNQGHPQQQRFIQN